MSEGTPAVELRLLGAMQFFVDGEPKKLPQRRATRQVWAYLALNSGRPMRREELPAVLWPDLDDSAGKKALRFGLSFLREFLTECCGSSERLTVDREWARWSVFPGDILDVSDFEKAAVAALDPLAGLFAAQGTSVSSISGSIAGNLGEAADATTRLALLQCAADAFGGELLSDWQDEWLEEPRRRLAHLHQRVVERLVIEAFARADYEQVIDVATELLDRYSHREVALGRLIAARYINGDVSGAVTTYDQFAGTLERDLKTAPSVEVQEVLAAILRGAPPEDVILLANRSTPFLAELDLDFDLPTVDRSVLRGAPNPSTLFVGREHEQAKVIQLATQHRLVTLLGPGGIGKTRLAAEVAHVLAGRLPDGAYWIDLTTVSDASQIPGTVLAALGISQQGSGRPIDFIIAHLGRQSAMLIFDNCEHVLGDVVGIVGAMLELCDDVRILATSREPLRLTEEHTFAVPSLDLPPEGPEIDETAVRSSSAVRLFLERAERARPGYASLVETVQHSATPAADRRTAPSESTSRRTNNSVASSSEPFDGLVVRTSLRPELVAVLAICRRMEGIPLAIELAAALISYLSAPEIATRLDKAIGILTHGSRSTPRRHQTLRAVVDWSYQLLSDAERQLFRRLGVFVGPFELEAARAVCFGDSPKVHSGAPTPTIANWSFAEANSASDSEVRWLLERLVTASLLVQEEAGNERRPAHYRLLDPIRQFAAERAQECGEAEDLGFRHAAYYFRLSEEALPHLKVNPEVAWLDRLDGAVTNIRTAMAWIADHGDVVAGMRLAGALWRFWYVRSHIDYERVWVESILVTQTLESQDRQEVDAKYVTDALECAGVLAFAQSDQPHAAKLYSRCCAILDARGETVRLAENLDRLALAESAVGEHEAALNHALRALEVKRAIGSAVGEAASLGIVADIFYHRQDWEKAHAYYAMSVETFDRIGNQTYARLRSIRGLALVERDRGDLENAKRLFEEGMAVARQFGKTHYEATWLHDLGTIAYKQGRLDDAHRLYAQAFRINLEMNEFPSLALLSNNLGQVAWLKGLEDEAVCLFEEALQYISYHPNTVERMVPLINLAAACSLRGEYERSEDYAVTASKLAGTLRLDILHYARMSILSSRSAWPGRTLSAWKQGL